MLTALENRHWKKLAELVKSAGADPQSAASLAGESARLARLVEIGMNRNATAQKILAVTGLGSVVVTAGVVTPSTKVSIPWPQNLHVRGVKAYAVEGLSALQHLNMSLVTNTSESFFMDQNGAPANVDFQTLQGTPIDPFLSYYPLDEYVQASVPWTIQCSSPDTTGTTSYTPLVTFLVEAWDPTTDPRIVTK